MKNTTIQKGQYAPQTRLYASTNHSFGKLPSLVMETKDGVITTSLDIIAETLPELMEDNNQTTEGGLVSKLVDNTLETVKKTRTKLTAKVRPEELSMYHPETVKAIMSIPDETLLRGLAKKDGLLKQHQIGPTKKYLGLDISKTTSVYDTGIQVLKEYKRKTEGNNNYTDKKTLSNSEITQIIKLQDQGMNAEESRLYVAHATKTILALAENIPDYRQEIAQYFGTKKLYVEQPTISRRKKPIQKKPTTKPNTNMKLTPDQTNALREALNETPEERAEYLKNKLFDEGVDAKVNIPSYNRASNF